MDLIKIANAMSIEELDNLAVDMMANAMKKKLAQKRAEKRNGWAVAPVAELSTLLREAVAKGDPVDVANFAAFLFAQGSKIVKRPPIPTAVVRPSEVNQVEAPHLKPSVIVRNGCFWFDGRRLHRGASKVNGHTVFYATPDVNEAAAEVTTRGHIYFADDNMGVLFGVSAIAKIEHGFLSMDYFADTTLGD